MMRYTLLFAVVALVPCAPASGRAQALPSRAANAKPRLDFYGDPLPRHALLRFGTVRLTHGARILGIFISPDARTVQAVDAAGTVLTWEAATGKQLAEVSLQADGIGEFVTLSPDRKLMAGTCSEGVGLWDSVTGKAKVVLKGGLPQSIRVLKPAFSGDGRTVLGLVATGQLVAWDAATGKKLRAIALEKPKPAGEQTPVPPAIVFSAFSSDTKLVAGARSGGKEVFLWDTGSGKLVRRLAGHPEGVGQVLFSEDARLLASGCMNGTVRVWQVDTGRLLLQFRNVSAYDFAFSADGKLLFLRGAEGGIHIHRLDNGKRLGRRSEGSERALGEGGFTVSGDGTLLVAHSVIGFAGSSRLFLWDVTSGKLLGKGHDAPVPCIFKGAAYSPDARSVFADSVTAFPNGRTHRYDLADGRHLRTYEGLLQGVGEGGKVVATMIDDQLCAHDARAGKALWRLQVSRSLSAADFSADGARVVLETRERQLRVADVQTGKVLKEYPPLPYRYARQAVLPNFRDDSVVYSPDLKSVAIADEKRRAVQVLDWKTGKVVCQLKDFPTGERYSLAFPPRANALLGIEADSAPTRLVVLHIPSGKQSSVVPAGAYLGWSPDGRVLCLKTDKGLVLWDVNARRVIRTLPAPGEVSSAVFSADGKWWRRPARRAPRSGR
jgi:WD40 repeat protein